MERRTTVPRWAIALYAVAYAIFCIAVAVIMMWAGAPLAAVPWAIGAIISGTIAMYTGISWQPKPTHAAVPLTGEAKVAPQEMQPATSHPDQHRPSVGTAMGG